MKSRFGVVDSLRNEVSIYLKITEAKFLENPDEKRDTFCVVYAGPMVDTFKFPFTPFCSFSVTLITFLFLVEFL